MNKVIKIVLMILFYCIGFIIQIVSKFAFGYNNYTETSILLGFSSMLPLAIAISLFGNVVFEKIKALKIFSYIIAGWIAIGFIILLILALIFEIQVLSNGSIVFS